MKALGSQRPGRQHGCQQLLQLCLIDGALARARCLRSRGFGGRLPRRSESFLRLGALLRLRWQYCSLTVTLAVAAPAIIVHVIMSCFGAAYSATLRSASALPCLQASSHSSDCTLLLGCISRSAGQIRLCCLPFLIVKTSTRGNHMHRWAVVVSSKTVYSGSMRQS